MPQPSLEASFLLNPWEKLPRKSIQEAPRPPLQSIRNIFQIKYSGGTQASFAKF